MLLLPESGWDYHTDHAHQSELDVPSSSHFTELHPATYYYGDVESYHPPLDSGLGAFVPVVAPQVSPRTTTDETGAPYIIYLYAHITGQVNCLKIPDSGGVSGQQSGYFPAQTHVI